MIGRDASRKFAGTCPFREEGVPTTPVLVPHQASADRWGIRTLEKRRLICSRGFGG